jgi:hypothetical protein
MRPRPSCARLPPSRRTGLGLSGDLLHCSGRGWGAATGRERAGRAMSSAAPWQPQLGHTAGTNLRPGRLELRQWRRLSLKQRAERSGNRARQAEGPSSKIKSSPRKKNLQTCNLQVFWTIIQDFQKAVRQRIFPR